MADETERRREAALRALAAETDDEKPPEPAAPAAEPGVSGGGSGRRGLMIAIIVAVLVVIGAGALILSSGGGSSDDTSDVATEPVVTNQPVDESIREVERTTTTEASTTTAPAPVELPPPAGLDPPPLDAPADDLARTAEQFAFYWTWLQANPDPALARDILAVGSPPHADMVALLEQLITDSQLVVFAGLSVEITDAHTHGDTADFTVDLIFDARVQVDAETGEVIQRLPQPGGRLSFHATVEPTPFGRWRVVVLERE